MKKYSVSLTLSVIADTEQEAIDMFATEIQDGNFGRDSIDIEEEV